MNNNFIPTVGQKCRVIGNCHPSIFGIIVEITEVSKNGVGCKYFSNIFNEEVITFGKHGGFEPV